MAHPQLFKHKAQPGVAGFGPPTLLFNLMVSTGPTAPQIAAGAPLVYAKGSCDFFTKDSPGPTYTRNASGILVDVGAANQRVEPEGVLIEPLCMNNVLYSNTFSNAAWTKTSCTVAANVTGPENAANSAWTVTASAATAAHGLKQTVTKDNIFGIFNVNGPIGYSIFVKNNATMPWVTIADDTFTNWWTFNSATGAVGDSSGFNICPMVRAYGNGFYLLGVGLPGNAGATFDFNVYFSKDQTHAKPVAGAMPTWLGAGETAVIWNAQGEFGGDGFVTSPMVTTSAATWRRQDYYYNLPAPTKGNVSLRINQRHCWDVPTQRLATASIVSPTFSSPNSFQLRPSGSNPAIETYNGSSVLSNAGIEFQPWTSGNAGPGFHAGSGILNVVDGSATFGSDAFSYTNPGSVSFTDRSAWSVNIVLQAGSSPFWVRNAEIWMGGIPTFGDISSDADLGTGVKVYAIGDNNTSGNSIRVPWATALQLGCAFPVPRALYKAGMESGAASALMGNFTPFIQGKGYATVINWTGEVDIFFGQTAATTYAYWKAFADAVIADGSHLVALNFCPWESHAGWPAGATAAIATLNTDISNYCAADPTHTTFIDIRTVIEDPGTPNQLNPAYSDDGDNLNQAGHAAVAAAVKSALGW